MRRNRDYFLLFLLLMTAILCGCSPQPDTVAPDGTFDNFFIATNQSIKIDAFGLKVDDSSEFSVGFRKCELVKNEEELTDIFQRAMAESEEIRIADVLNIQWDLGKDTWEEKDAFADFLKEEFVPEKDGLYRMEIIAVDIYGNATVMNSYALVDTTAPVISGAEDTKMIILKETDSENITTEGVTAEDNMFGDLTAQIIVSEEIIEELDEEVTGFKAKVTYTVADFMGNETVLERIMDFNFEKKFMVQESQESVVESVPDGFHKDMAQEALALVNQKRKEAGLHELIWDEGMYEFACTRTLEIISKFSHERPDGTVVTDSLHAMGYTVGNGENIARYSKNASIVVEDWMNSPSHKENILRDYFYYSAIGCYSHNGRYYWVNLFRG